MVDDDVVVFSTDFAWRKPPTIAPDPLPQVRPANLTYAEYEQRFGKPTTVVVDSEPKKLKLSELIKKANEPVDEELDDEDPAEELSEQCQRVLPLLEKEYASADRDDLIDLLRDIDNEALDGTESDEEVQATARMMLDSGELRNWAYNYVMPAELAALLYVQHHGAEWADAGTFDNNLVAVVDSFDDWATEHADERIRTEVTIPNDLDYHYEFDYESYANDLRQAYDVIEEDASSGVLILTE
jgi:hypothetical protein